MEALISLLGWKLSVSDQKRKPFESVFVSLGVQVDFSKMREGSLILGNKPGRVDSIAVQVNDILEKKPPVLGFKDALSIRGRLSFAEGQTFCKLTAPTARLLARWSAVSFPRPITSELELHLRFAIKHLQDAGPRVIGPKRNDPPVVVFTDGACEEGAGGTSIGGVLLKPGGCCECFGAKLSQEAVDSWKTKVGQTQVIGQAEVFPVWVARLTWAKELAGRRVIFFINSESARLALIKGYSPILPTLKILMSVIGWDCKNHCYPGYARVPTFSNISDGPSRMTLEAFPAGMVPKVVCPVLPDGMVPDAVLK